MTRAEVAAGPRVHGFHTVAGLVLPCYGEEVMVASPESSAAADSGLSPRDRSILDFEREWWRHAGAKEEAIRETFGLSTARYYQILNVVIESENAVRYDPMLVGRLQRVRDSRTQARTSRSFTSTSGSSSVNADDASRLPPTTANPIE